MAQTLTKQMLIDWGITGVYEDLRSPGGYRVEIHNKPVKAWKDCYGWKITVTDKTRLIRLPNGRKQPYRKALTLPRVVIAWKFGEIKGNEVAYYIPEYNECVAISRVDFWKLNINKWASSKKGENEK